MSKIAIIGTGAVGAGLARNLVRHGIAVQLASADLEKTRAVAAALGDPATAVATAALAGVDLVLLAVPATARERDLDHVAHADSIARAVR
jgi:predicted dinucleotide-binding enzyme